MTNTEVHEASDAIELEMKRLNLELMREQVDAMNEKKEARRLKLQQQQRDIAENDKLKAQREKNCRHKKGGRNKEGLDRGQSANYAVIQNTYPAGEVQIMCQRCGATWDNPPIELKATDPALYEQKLREYRRALEWPTDNEPSGTQIFLITRNNPTPQQAPKTKAPATPRTRKPKTPKTKVA